MPETLALSSNAALSVSYENRTSPTPTASPGCLSHLVMMQLSPIAPAGAYDGYRHLTSSYIGFFLNHSISVPFGFNPAQTFPSN